MSKQDAKLLLENAIKTLAKNAIQNKHIMNYIEQLEQYIYALEQEEDAQKESNESKAE